jgi:IMP dehydrogenase
VAEIEIGIGKTGRRAYGFDEVTIVPSRRTRDQANVDLSWQIDAFRFDLPLMAAGADSVVSPATAIAIGGLGGLAVLNVEGLWARYEDPEPLLEEIAALAPEKVTGRLQEIYAEPVKPDLIGERVRHIAAAGVTTCVSVTPQRVEALAPHILRAEPDLVVIQGTVVSAEHVSKSVEPLNLKRWVREFEIPVIVGGCVSYQAALHLMRTGAAGVLVGVGSGHASTARRVLGVGVPMATAVADARAARMRHLDETGVYVHVIADGGMATGGDIAKAIVCGADAVMIGAPLAAAHEAPGRGFHWSRAVHHPTLPRGVRVEVGPRAPLDEIVLGPAHDASGSTNLFGALRTTMALCGYESLKELQKAEIMVAPGVQTEGKRLQ